MKTVTVGDIILMAFFLGVGVGSGFFLWRKTPVGTVCIVKSQAGYQPIVLPRDTVITVTGPVGKTVVELKGKRVRVRYSDCRDKICVRTGWVERSGQLIVCAPNRVIVQIRGQEGIDAVTR
ncbi:MAG: NusG domain II-containing protein [bacterium]